MEKNCFDIATEDGNLFCRCDASGEHPVFYGKNGSLSLDLLLKQMSNPALAREMRSKKSRQRGN